MEDSMNQMVGMPGLEPGTFALKGRCSTNWATFPNRFGSEIIYKNMSLSNFFSFFSCFSFAIQRKKHIFMKIFTMNWIFQSWRQYVATLLIFILLISQTIRVDFFDDVAASQEKYRDIVSMYVDRNTYKELKPKINRYAEDIQSYLGSTRVSIFIIDSDTSPTHIASQNEKLYYEWDNEKGIVSQLVWTIIVWDIPIPVVDSWDGSFPTVYPYVDFVDKKFLYNENAKRYIFSDNENQTPVEPEIWHGVMNPAVGRTFERVEREEKVWQINPTPTPSNTGAFITKKIESDISKISEFLDKSHDFYTQKWVFAPSGIPPRVFYYDGFLESQAFSIEDIWSYKLYLSHAEEIIYNRYSKHFLQYITSEIAKSKKQFNKEELEYIDSLGFSWTTTSIFPDDQLATIPDVHSKQVILWLLKKFHDLINKQALWDIRSAVHNAGRYNSGSEVRVDQPAVNVSLMDYAAMNTLRKVNDKLEEYIDAQEVGLGFLLVPYDNLTIKEPDAMGFSDSRNQAWSVSMIGTNRIYDNYLFGEEVQNITNANKCSIARWTDNTQWKYKQWILVEANSAFDVYSTESSIKNYEKDGKKWVDCASNDDNQSTYKTDVYWWNNFISNADTSKWTLNQPSWLQGFYEPIFSLGWMKEVNQTWAKINHIPGGDWAKEWELKPALTDYCHQWPYTYMLQQASKRTDYSNASSFGKTVNWPGDGKFWQEWDPEISCLTKQEEFSQPTWQGKKVPYTREGSSEYDYHYAPAGPDWKWWELPPNMIGACAHGMVTFQNVKQIGDTKLPQVTDGISPYTWACLPEIKCTNPQRWETLYECMSQALGKVVNTLIDSSPIWPCPNTPWTSPAEWVLYSTACPVYGAAWVSGYKYPPFMGGNFRERYWTKIMDGDKFQSPCLVSFWWMTGDGTFTRWIRYPCLIVQKQQSWASHWDDKQSWGGNFLDVSTYETQYFHTINDSRVFHKSPTDEEMNAAKKNATTPSLPIDHDRYVSFYIAPANSHVIYYPNLFRFDEAEILTRHKDQIATEISTDYGRERLKKYASGALLITAYRLELDRLWKAAWAWKENTSGMWVTPPDPAGWWWVTPPKSTSWFATLNRTGWPLSDDDIAAAIRAKRWLHPDVTIKMKQAIETWLSYAHEYGSGWELKQEDIVKALQDVPAFLSTITGSLTSPPKIPTMTGAYEVAYLGLTQFIPKWLSDASQTLDSNGWTLLDATEQYNQWRAEIDGLNTAQEDAEDASSISPAPSDACWPPEWVSIFQWPAAIQCWIKSLVPLRITWNACTANSIGLDSGIFAASENNQSLWGIRQLPVIGISPQDSWTLSGMTNFYSWSKLTYHLSHNRVLPSENLQTHFFLTKNNARLAVTPWSKLQMNIEKIVDINGKTVDPQWYNEYVSIAPNPTPFSDIGASSLIQSKNKLWTIYIRAVLQIPTTDWNTFTTSSDLFPVLITDEFLSVIPKVWTYVTSMLPVTSLSGMTFDFAVKNTQWKISPPKYPITLDIYDDITGSSIATGITINTPSYALPDQYRRQVWLIRLEFIDSQKRHATQSIAIQSWPLQRASFSPVSSALMKDSNTLVYLRLRDAFGNPIAPDLHSIDVTASGGYFVLQNGEKKNTIHIDSMEAEVPIVVWSDIAGKITLEAKVDKTITTSIELAVFERAQIIVSRVWNPKVGWSKIPVNIRVVWVDGKPISWFNSIVSLNLPKWAGVFGPNITTILNGVSEDILYTPGTLAGNHQIKLAIPWIGPVPDIDFSVDPWSPLYIAHIEDTDSMHFSLQDRYGNIVPTTLSGTLEVWWKTPTSIAFTQWILSVPKTAGYMLVTVPALSENTLTYSDSLWSHTIRWIPKYIAWVRSLPDRFNFVEDYNARYTILAWWAFLRESEDILYNTSYGSWQSLAVTTLLDSPYKKEAIFTILPGGWFFLGKTPEVLPEVSLSLQDGYPLVSTKDAVSRRIIARAQYKIDRPTLIACPTDTSCNNDSTISSIQLLSVDAWYQAQRQDKALSLLQWTQNILNVTEDGKLTYSPWVILQINPDKSSNSLVIDILSTRWKIATLIYKASTNTSIIKKSQWNNIQIENTIILDDITAFSSEKFSLSRLADTVTWYRYTYESTVPVFDEIKNWPSVIESIWNTPDISWIGWKWTNKMLLSYAGGDTVGEASKWFHSYTLINLGDPVTHNDVKANGTRLDWVDRSVGTQLTSLQASPVRAFSQKDMNKDGYEDIVVQHTDWYIELLLNLWNRIRSRGNIAYIPDLVSNGISFGDFTQDGYADIIGTDKVGNFVLLSNEERRFNRQKIRVDTGSIAPIGVTQFRVRDMDDDKKDDIVYITQAWELSILYGTSTVWLFEKKILDATLGLTLSKESITTGGAIFTQNIPQVSLDTVTTWSWPDESYIWNEIYTRYISTDSQTPSTSVDVSDSNALASFEKDFSDLNAHAYSSQSVQSKNFARSEYAPAFGMEISKKFLLSTWSLLRPGSRVKVEINIKNTTNSLIKSWEYLDTIPEIFSTENTLKYTIKQWNNTVTRDFTLATSSDFDAHFTLIDIPAGQAISLSYELTALPVSYWELLVGNYEQGETWSDIYGDVWFKTDTTCGADMMLWRSESAPIRTYTKWTRSFSDANFSTSVMNQLADTNNDGIPDTVAQPSQQQQQDIFDTIRDAPHSDPSKIYVGSDKNTFTIGFDPLSLQEIENQLHEIAQWLSCGFWGWGCLALPINWAPLSSWNDPVAFGYPIGDGFRVDEWVPLFSGLTRIDVGPPWYCYKIPAVWPASPLKMDAPVSCNPANVWLAFSEASQAIASGYKRQLQWTATSISTTTLSDIFNAGSNYFTAWLPNPASLIWAGWYLGIDSKMNSIRIYATPTLTLGVGMGVCFGATARLYGGNPWKAVWPLAQAGNCIVATRPMNLCSNDGTIHDGDIRNVVWLGSIADTWNAGSSTSIPWGASCGMIAKTQTEIENTAFQSAIIDYARSPNPTKLPSLYNRLSQKPLRTNKSNWPLLSIGWGNPDDALLGVEVSIDLAKPLWSQKIIQLKNKRVAGFPDFIMDWVSRQTDELVNALFTPPNLIIIPPTSIGQNMQFDGTLNGFTETFKKSLDSVSVSTIQQKMWEAYDTEVNSQSASKAFQNLTKSSNNNATSDIGKWMNEQQNNFNNFQDSIFKGELGKIADKGKWWISAMRAAYKLIWKLPLITISEKTVPIDVPWILPQELDKYARSLDAYAKEINSAIENLCLNDPSPQCLEKKATIQAGPFLASINENLKRIEEYKNFPLKLQKYITWKQRYLWQILCYIETVQQMTTGWLKDNSIRFRKWAELWVLIRAIADSWQPLLDIIIQKDAQCSVCHNERYNAKNWKYKILSLLIPSIPIIQFPRWPDVILDLSDVRLGFNISMPNFQFNLKPIRLPDLPSVTLPDLPSVTLGPIPVLPPIPPLPDLPDLPAIPTIKLPNLPPPPKLPKILSSLKIIIKLLKLYKLLECYLNKTPLVPEWTLWDIIAQRTERQWYLPIDFLDINLPQISIPWIREIRISSHVNFEIDSDFITEFARAAVAPINQFNADLGRWIPKKIGEDINIATPNNIDINLQSFLPPGTNEIIAEYRNILEQDKDITLDVDDFAQELKSQMASTPELAHLAPKLTESIRKSWLESDALTQELQIYQQKRFDILREYIKLQHDETSTMQNIVDMLTQETHLLADGDIKRSLMVSESLQMRSSQLIAHWNDTSIDSITSDEEIVDDELSSTRDEFVARVKRITANQEQTISPLAANTVPSTYAPNFQWIYIVTENWTQVRLFDYTESLKKDDPSVKTDIDKDGDMDYLFILDGALYLKRTSTKDTRKIIDTTLRVEDISSEVLAAPDFFRENQSIPNNLTFSYQSRQATGSIWRADLFDRYMEWDMLALWEHDNQKTPQHTIEIFAPSDTVWVTEKKVLRSLDRVENRSTFVMEWPKMQILTGSLDFILSPWRVLYTGAKSVKISYGTWTDQPHIQKVLSPHRGYSFDDVANVSFDDGTLYIIYPSIVSESYSFSDDMIDMPILPGMRISSGAGKVVLYDHLQDRDIQITEQSFYHAESATRLGNNYDIQMSYPNWFYSARIENQDSEKSISTREVLFTPQSASDVSPPEVDIRDAVRIPVYQKKSYKLNDIITDTNKYTVRIDPDATQDSDNNGIYDDDFGVQWAWVWVDDTTISFGPYDTIGKKQIILEVTDEFYNSVLVPVNLQVYAPIPNLTQVNLWWYLSGTLSESYSQEPIHIFRIRPWSNMVRLPHWTILTQSNWSFETQDLSTRTGITLTASWNKIALSQKGWTQLLPPSYTSRVIFATESSPLSLEILNEKWIPIYRSIFTLPKDAKIVANVWNNDIPPETLAITTYTGYNFVDAAYNDPNIPWGYYVVDTNMVPIALIARDGNIYSAKSTLTSSVTYENDNVVIYLLVAGNTVAKMLYKFDFFYTLK